MNLDYLDQLNRIQLLELAWRLIPKRKVWIEARQGPAGLASVERALYRDADILFTNQTVTAGARRLAKEADIRVIGRTEIARLLWQKGVWKRVRRSMWQTLNTAEDNHLTPSLTPAYADAEVQIGSNIAA